MNNDDGPPPLEDRYSSAVRSKNLRSVERTSFSDSDVVGAVGMAARERPLAMALLRLFVGDNRSADEVLKILEDMAVGKAFRLDVEITRPEAYDLCAAVLAWHRDGVCRKCNGLGLLKMPNAPTLSTHRCRACRGVGRMPFDRQFSMERLMLARWVSAEIDREQAYAGPLAMKRLASLMDL